MGTLVRLHVLLYCALVALGATVIGCSPDDEIVVGFYGDEKLSDEAPVPFFLKPVFPNPTEGIALIRFGTTTTMRIQLRIYTEDWQEVNQVFDRTFAPGMYQYQLNINHDFAHGVYYCVMEGGGYTQIQTMRVVK